MALLLRKSPISLSNSEARPSQRQDSWRKTGNGTGRHVLDDGVALVDARGALAVCVRVVSGRLWCILSRRRLTKAERDHSDSSLQTVISVHAERRRGQTDRPWNSSDIAVEQNAAAAAQSIASTLSTQASLYRFSQRGT